MPLIQERWHDGRVAEHRTYEQVSKRMFNTTRGSPPHSAFTTTIWVEGYAKSEDSSVFTYFPFAAVFASPEARNLSLDVLTVSENAEHACWTWKCLE